jgi:NAD(P)-dependent dehydrogenase (short-subunit alcohol dehydrogenase family)
MNPKDIFSLEGKTAVITGAGSGIGRAIAILFARQGAHVEVLDRSLASAEETVAEIRRAGGAASCQLCDVSDHAAAGAAIRKAAIARGRLDILVNNAGIAHVGSVLQTTEEDFDRIYRVNVKGVFNCLKAGVELMAAGGGGSIVNLASTASLLGIPDRFAYSMSKGAVLTMTLSVARDYLQQKIRCNAICPGRIHTPFVDGFIKKNYPGRETEMFQKLSEYQPIGRMGKPEEVAAVALFLASDEASFVTGSAYTVDGGTFALR